jgi:hypothetical protein
MSTGWFGLVREVKHALATVNADRNKAGEFLITGAPVIVGLDADEVVVPAEACYLVGGKPCSLAGLMNSTSYGVRGIMVI